MAAAIGLSACAVLVAEAAPASNMSQTGTELDDQQERRDDVEDDDLGAPMPLHERSERQHQQAVHQQQDADDRPRGIARRQALAEDRRAGVDERGQQREGDSAHARMLGSGHRGCKRFQRGEAGPRGEEDQVTETTIAFTELLGSPGADGDLGGPEGLDLPEDPRGPRRGALGRRGEARAPTSSTRPWCASRSTASGSRTSTAS